MCIYTCVHISGAVCEPCPYLSVRHVSVFVFQVGADFEVLGDTVGLVTLCVYGGAPMSPQENALRRGVDIVVGTPGRIKVGGVPAGRVDGDGGRLGLQGGRCDDGSEMARRK